MTTISVHEELESMPEDYLAHLLEATQTKIVKSTEKLEARAKRLPSETIAKIALSINAQRWLLRALQEEAVRRQKSFSM